MRIATSTTYAQQANQIDNLSAQYQGIGQQLSSGKALNQPSDDPTHIAQDLSVRTAIGSENATAVNVRDATNTLTTTDSALAGLTAALQSARQIAVHGATDTISLDQRKALASQVDGLIAEVIGFANTNVAGKYVFAGTKYPSAPPVTPSGTPTNAVAVTANNESQGQIFINGQQVPLTTSLQEGFNFGAADNSLSAFQTLINLRNTLSGSGSTILNGNAAPPTAGVINGTIIDQSASSLNVKGQVIAPATTLGAAGIFATPQTLDNGAPPSASLVIDGSGGSATITVTAATTVTALLAQINGSATGVSAAFDQATQRITLSSPNAFHLTDVPTPGTGATTNGNLSAQLGLTAQADVVNSLSRQLGDIDKALNVNLQARSVVGSRIQNLNGTLSFTNTRVTDDTKVQSNLEDADIAKATTQFSLTQTVLQAAYATTTKLEGKTLFDYL